MYFCVYKKTSKRKRDPHSAIFCSCIDTHNIGLRFVKAVRLVPFTAGDWGSGLCQHSLPTCQGRVVYSYFGLTGKFTIWRWTHKFIFKPWAPAYLNATVLWCTEILRGGVSKIQIGSHDAERRRCWCWFLLLGWSVMS